MLCQLLLWLRCSELIGIERGRGDDDDDDAVYNTTINLYLCILIVERSSDRISNICDLVRVLIIHKSLNQ